MSKRKKPTKKGRVSDLLKVDEKRSCKARSLCKLRGFVLQTADYDMDHKLMMSVQEGEVASESCSSPTTNGSVIRHDLDPNVFEKMYILAVDFGLSVGGFFVQLFPFLWDLLFTNLLQPKEERLPDNISQLLDPKVFSRLSGKPVSKVEYSVRLEQHANSTDRAWFKIKYEDQKKESFVFAKMQAKTFMVRAMMCMFDVYRNELETYKRVRMPVLTPNVHIAQWTRSRFVLALEDLRHQQVTFPNIWETKVDKDLAKQVLATLAKVHGKFWNRPPPGGWSDATRPYKPKFMGFYTLRNVEKACPGLISRDMHQVFSTALWHFDKLRAFYSRGPHKTMVLGDEHMGNFYITKHGVVGCFDFQCRAEEHPMRDVTYFLCSSYQEDSLGADEVELIKYYLAELEKNGVSKSDMPSFNECWLQYRLQSFYAMYAFVFSGGFSDLMDPVQTWYGVRRIIAQMKRVDSAGALYDLLERKI